MDAENSASSSLGDQILSTDTRTPQIFPILNLPREIRDKIYRELVSISCTKSQKKFPPGGHGTPYKYNWNLDLSILYLNKQIHDEAREVLGRENDFVMLQRGAWTLALTEQEMVNSDPRFTQQGPPVWPGEPCKHPPDVPGLRMKLWFGRPKGVETGDVFIISHDELQDFCIYISTLRYTEDNGRYRLEGMMLTATFVKPLPWMYKKTIWDSTAVLLKPLRKLRLILTTNFMDFPVPSLRHVALLTSRAFDKDFVRTTIRELLHNGDCAYRFGHLNVAFAYYNDMSNYHDHFVEHSPFFPDDEEMASWMFTFSQRFAMVSLENGNYRDTLGFAGTAINNMAVLFGLPPRSFHPDPAAALQPASAHTDTNSLRSLRLNVQRKSKRIRAAAKKFNHCIRLEDIGRCYYYRSIAWQALSGSRAPNIDLGLAIGCIVYSGMAKKEQEAIFDELKEFRNRVFARVREQERVSSKVTVGVVTLVWE